MLVLINGNSSTLPDNSTVADAINQLALGSHGIAVAVNLTVISQDSWAQHELQENDSITIIQPVQGG